MKERGGYPSEKGWWNKEAEQITDQVKRFCPKCSIPIPLPRHDCKKGCELISKTNAGRLARVGSRKLLEGKMIIVDKKFTEDDIAKVVADGWAPWHFRDYVQHIPEAKEAVLKWEGKADFWKK